VSRDLEPIGGTFDDVFARLGMPRPQLQAEMAAEWETLAGKPWVGRSRPLMIRGSTLVVEASSPSTVSLLRYGESGLLATLEKRFGAGVVTAVEIVAKGRR
jgi:hypothetical protein